jgi:hypothetical protein
MAFQVCTQQNFRVRSEEFIFYLNYSEDDIENHGEKNNGYRTSFYQRTKEQDTQVYQKIRNPKETLKPSHLENGPVIFSDDIRPTPERQTSINNKPLPNQWIFGRKQKDKLNLISWLIDGCYFYTEQEQVLQVLSSSKKFKKCEYADNPKDNPDNHSNPPEFQSFDGFFNNPFKVDLGAVGKDKVCKYLYCCV